MARGEHWAPREVWKHPTVYYHVVRFGPTFDGQYPVPDDAIPLGIEEGKPEKWLVCLIPQLELVDDSGQLVRVKSR